MLSDHINVKLTGTRLASWLGFATRVTEKGVKNTTPAVLNKLIDMIPEYEALMEIKSEYGKNPQPRPIDDIESNKTEKE